MPNQKLKQIFPESWRWILFSRRIQGWLSDSEADQLFKLARNFTPNERPVAVELGSWKGKSSVIIAAGLRGKRSPRLYCIDPFGRDENPDYQKAYYDSLIQENTRPVEEIFRRNIKRFGADDIIVPLRGYSFEFKSTWIEPLDFLFIDANHEYAAVLRDFSDWSPFLKPGGVIAFHDVSPEWPGCCRVVSENVKLPEFTPVQHIDSLAWASKRKIGSDSRYTGGLSMHRTVYDSTFFDQVTQGSLSSARIILPILFEYYKPKSIVDIGCGRGAWLKVAAERGVQQLLGIDGDYLYRETLLIDTQHFQAVDLAERFEIAEKFDLAICLEVAEHLPLHRAETFVADLVRLSDVVLFSAALPYQFGTDHINEQWLEFWAIIFRHHGYVPCDLFRSQIWDNKDVEFWYRQNVILFCPPALARSLFPAETLATHRPLSFVHPLTLLANVTGYRPLSEQVHNSECEDYHSVLAAYLSGETTVPALKILDATTQVDGAKVYLFPKARLERVNPSAEIGARDNEIRGLSAKLAEASIKSGRLSSELSACDDKVATLSQALSEREGEISSLAQALTERDSKVVSLNQALTERDGTISGVLRSRSWRVTAPLRALMGVARHLIGLPNRLITRNRGEARFEILGMSQWVPRLRRIATLVPARYRRFLREAWYKRAIARSGLFDAAYYLAQNPDVAKAGVEPINHYFRFGAVEGRDPHPLFDTSYYLEQSPDVAKAGVNPLAHYLVRGANEGRDPHPFFDSSYYLYQYHDVAAACVNPLAHYLTHGAAEGRDPNRYFDTSFYLEQNPAVASIGVNPLLHYLAEGYREGREPSAQFNGKAYLQLNPDVARTGINPLLHYLTRGLTEGRSSMINPSLTLVSHVSRLSRAPGDGSASVLVFDYALPTPDMDSASVRMFSLLRLLREIGHHVTFVAGGAGLQPRYSYGDQGLPRYERRLLDLGIDVLGGFDAAVAHLRAFGSRYGIVILSRPEVCRQYLAPVRAFAVRARVVYDTVDLHCLRFERGAQLTGDAQAARQAAEYRKIEGVNITCADLVLAVTYEERRRILTDWPNARVEVIPNIHSVRVQSRPYSERKNLLFIGRFDHMPNPDAVTWFANEIFPIILRELPQVRFLIVGSKVPDSLRALVSPNVELVGWLPDADPCFERSKVLVAPLRYGAGIKGKIGQAMSLGLPVVTTSVGAEGMMLTDGVHALVADNPNDFARAVVRLYNDPALWGEIQRQAAAHIEKNFSENAVCELLRTLFPLQGSEEAQKARAAAND